MRSEHHRAMLNITIHRILQYTVFQKKPSLQTLVVTLSNRNQFLQGVSVAASPVIAMIGKPSVRLSVRHNLALCENEAD